MYRYVLSSVLTLLEVMTINLQKQYMMSGHIFNIYTFLEKFNSILYLI